MIGVDGARLGGRLYHATRPEHVPSIRQRGLLPGGVAQGWLRDPEFCAFVERAFGCHPIFLSCDPNDWTNRDDWRSRGLSNGQPALLQVDVRGLRLVPDIASLYSGGGGFRHPDDDAPTGLAWRQAESAVPDELLPIWEAAARFRSRPCSTRLPSRESRRQRTRPVSIRLNRTEYCGFLEAARNPLP